jgi:hypothetical protein
MKVFLRVLRSLFVRFGFVSTHQPQQLDFLESLEVPVRAREGVRFHSLSK